MIKSGVGTAPDFAVSTAIPGRRDAAGPQSINCVGDAWRKPSVVDTIVVYGFRARELRSRPGMTGSLFERRQLLPHLADPGPRVALLRAEAARDVEHGELVRLETWPELIPVDRRRHRSAGARAGRIGDHRGRAASVAQIIEEDLSLADALGHLGHVAIRRIRLHGEHH